MTSYGQTAACVRAAIGASVSGAEGDRYAGDEGDGAWERLLVAAIEVTVDVGCSAATLDAITARAGLSRERVDACFSGVDAVVLAAYDVLATGTLVEACRRGRGHPGHTERLSVGLGYVLDTMAAHPGVTRVWVDELPQVGRAALVQQDRTLALLGRMLRVGPESPSPMHEQFLAGGVWETIRATVAGDGAAALPARLEDLVAWVALSSATGA